MAVVYQIDYTFDDPNDLVNPVPLASAAWDATLVSSVAQAGATSTTFTIGTAPIWARVRLVDGVSSVRAVFTQYSQHSYSSFGPPPPPVLKPVNVTAPVVSGTTTVGSTLSCTTGTWTNSPTSFAYQWLRNGVAISGATASTYVVVAGDLGTSISCLVTATNAFGSGVTTSNALSIALPLPANTVAPVASGATTIGSTLSCTTGTWTNSPTSFAYQWRRGGVNISGATSSTYVTVTADDGTSVGCVVTATNAGGSASQASNTLAISSVVASVWSASDAAAGSMTLSNGGLTVTPQVNGPQWYTIRTSTSKNSGKLYIEFAVGASVTGTGIDFGASGGSFVLVANGYLGSVADSGGCIPAYDTPAMAAFAQGYSVSSLPSPAPNSVYAFAIDFTAGEIWLSVNNVWVGSSNPATGSVPTLTFTPATIGMLSAGMSFLGTGCGVWTLHPTDASLVYRPPPGFQAWDGGPVTPSPSVWSAADAAVTGATISNGGLTVKGITGQWNTTRTTVGKTSGKLYVEFLINAKAGDYDLFGLAAGGGVSLVSVLGNNNGISTGVNPPVQIFGSGGFVPMYNDTRVPAANDVWALAVDFSSSSMWIAQNNVWANSSDPVSGTLPIVTFTLVKALPFSSQPLFAAITEGNGATITLQATAASQRYAPPSGFVAWDGGVAPAWTPASLPGLVAWYDAQDASTITLSGSFVTQWNDKSGHGYHVSQATAGYQPTLLSTGLNGKPVLHFDPTTNVQTLVATVPSGLFPAGVGAYFVSSLQDASGLGHTNCAPLYHTNDLYPEPWSRRDTVTFIGDGPIGNYYPFNTYSLVGTGPAYWGFRYVHATDHYDDWLNGAQVSNGTFGAGAYASTATNFRVGSREDGGPVLMGNVGEIVVCSSLLEPDRIRLEAYLAAKWGFGASSQARAYLARTVGGNEGGNATNIANLIDGLVADGVWAKLDCLYVLAQQNATDALLNLVGTSYTLTNPGSATFAQYNGYSGFNLGTNGLVTGFNPATAPSSMFSQNSASFGFWSLGGVPSEDKSEMGTTAAGTVGESHLYVDYSGGLLYTRVNNPTIGSVPAIGSVGFVSGDRPSSSNVIPYFNGVAQVTQTGTSQVPESAVFTIGWVSPSNAGSFLQFSAAFIGASLGSAGQLALYNRLNTYMTAVAPVTSVWSAADAAANAMTLSNGGLTVTPSGTAAWQSIRSSISQSSGKLYVEFKNTVNATTQNILLGMADSSFVSTNYLGSGGVSFGTNFGGGQQQTAGFAAFAGGSVLPVANDVMAWAIDFAAGKIWLAYNNVFVGSGNPATGVNPTWTIAAPATGVPLFPAMTYNGSVCGVWTLQATAASQKYTPPAGFTPWG